MDSPLYALLFTEDLVEFVLKKFEITWVENKNGIRRLRDHIENYNFDSDVAECVYFLVRYYSNTIKENYQALMERGVASIHDFRYECAVTIILYFSASGYDNVKFLKMCASLVGLSQQYFEKNDEHLAKRIALAASEILAYLINYFSMKQMIKPGDLWFKLKLTARVLIRKIFMNLPLPDFDEEILSLSSRIVV